MREILGGIMSEIIMPWPVDLPMGNKSGVLMSLPDSYDLKEQRKNRVLLVDDSIRAITALNRIFCELDCSTIVGFDGYAAISTLVEQNIDLMVLDMTMPSLSGEETLLRADALLSEIALMEGWKHKIPVVIYTGREEELYIREEEIQFFNIVDTWKKPISFSALSIKANEVLSFIDK